MVTNMKKISDAVSNHIEDNAELFANVNYDIVINEKKAEKFGMAAVTTMMEVPTDKDGNAFPEEKYISVTLYVMEKKNGTEVIIVNDDSHDIIFNSFGFDTKPDNFDESRREFIPITDMVITRLCSYLDTTMKWVKKYPKEGKKFVKKGKKGKH